MDFLPIESKEDEKRVSKKTMAPPSSAARRGRRAQEVRKEKRNMTLINVRASTLKLQNFIRNVIGIEIVIRKFVFPVEFYQPISSGQF